jgi:light-regulated signal transduction histidine kinase (bacteriophytochrome)
MSGRTDPIPPAPPLHDAAGDFDRFIYMITHDVRSCVRALREVPQWIAEDLADAGHRIEDSLADNIDLLNTHTRRLDRMLDDLLTYARIGRMQKVVDNDLGQAVQSVLRDVQVPGRVRVEIDLQEPRLTLGERDLLTMLAALFSNSVRHRDDETSVIRFTCRRAGDEVVLTYCDDGPGIPQEMRGRALTPMTTLKSRDEVEGSGMGLAHVAKIVSVHRGRLDWLDLPGPRGLGYELRFPA